MPNHPLFFLAGLLLFSLTPPLRSSSYIPQTDGADKAVARRVTEGSDNALKGLYKRAKEITRPSKFSKKKGPLYSGTDVIAVLRMSKADLLSTLTTPELLPLRAYVERFYSIPTVSELDVQHEEYGHLFISEDDRDKLLLSGERFLEHIWRTAGDLTVDLKVNSQPVHEAKYDMWPSGGDHLTTMTNNTLDNVYRGYYTYRVTKPGYKTIEEPLNLVDSEKHTLDCTLYKVSEPDGPHPCKLN